MSGKVAVVTDGEVRVWPFFPRDLASWNRITSLYFSAFLVSDRCGHEHGRRGHPDISGL